MLLKEKSKRGFCHTKHKYKMLFQNGLCKYLKRMFEKISIRTGDILLFFVLGR